MAETGGKTVYHRLFFLSSPFPRSSLRLRALSLFQLRDTLRLGLTHALVAVCVSLLLTLACGTASNPVPDALTENGAKTSPTQPTATPSPTPTTTLTPAIEATPTSMATPPRTPEPTWTPTPTPLPTPSVQLKQTLDTVYYLVTGTTTKAIFDSIERNGPDLVEAGPWHFASGQTESNASLESQGLDYGEFCVLQSAEINLDLIVTLPQHSNPSSLSNLLIKRWQAFAEGVAAHEQTHVDIYIERIESLLARLEDFSERFSDCDSLEAQLHSIQDEERLVIDRQQEAFHESEVRLSEGVRQPAKQRIDDNKLKLAEYQVELDRLTSDIEVLKIEIADFETAMERYDAIIATIKKQYPTLVLPSGTLAQYIRLVDGRNSLSCLRSEVATNVNPVIEQYGRIVEDHIRLTEQTNQLIDRLPWLTDYNTGEEPSILTNESSPEPAATSMSAPTATPFLAPLTNLIAFYSKRDGNDEIYVMNADGSDQTRLTNDPARDYEATWSPDGRLIAFVPYRDGNDEIYVMSVDGSNQRNLTNDPARETRPTWSPDGKRIAFTSNRCSERGNVYVMNVDGSNVRNLTSKSGDGHGPVWSPDGKLIAFLAWRDSADEQIHVMGADGSNQRRLTNRESPNRGPRWSPDGKLIAYYSLEDDNTWEVYVMNADGSAQARLTSNSAHDTGPVWSPDGESIVFTSNRDGNSEIYVMNADGSDQRNLTNAPGDDLSPAWRRDGKLIGFQSNREGNWEIYVMNADGSDQRRLTNNEAPDYFIAWSPLLPAAILREGG